MKNWLGRAFMRAAHQEVPIDQKSTQIQHPLIALQLSHRAQWSGRDYAALAQQGYQKNAVAYRCVRLISEAAASIALCARRQTRHGQICERGDPAARFFRAVIP